MASGNTLLDRPLVPVASEEDARKTYRKLRELIDAERVRPRFVYVVEKAGGGIDKASVEQRELHAEDAFRAVEEMAAADGIEIETEIHYGTDVAATIIEAAREMDATAIVFASRGGGSWLDAISGGVRSSLVTKSDRPVVALPSASE